MRAGMLTLKHCLIWHRWKLAKDTGVIQYHECKDCGSRKAESIDGGGYQPLNIDWLCRRNNDWFGPKRTGKEAE